MKRILVFFFGCANNDSGHYMWAPHWRRPNNPNACDNIARVLGDSPVKGRPQIDNGWLAPNGREGQAAYVCRNGWTGIQWRDNSVDNRSGSNASFWAKGEWTAAELLSAGFDSFPGLEERLRAPVTLVHHYDPEPPR